VLRPWRAITLYGTYGEAFRPDTSGRPIFGSTEKLAPETGILKEVGAKTDFFDSRVSVNVALYDIYKENIVSTDPLHPGFIVQDGQERSKGYEVSFNLDPTRNLTLFGGYNHVNAKVTIDPQRASTVGVLLPNTPRNSYQLWAKYSVREGRLRGLGFGLGVQYVDERKGRTNTTNIIPEYTVYNAQANYAWRAYRFNVYVANLFDKVYYSSGSSFNVRPGVPLSFRASVRTLF
jgi:iron complex outermembrane receptor protein